MSACLKKLFFAIFVLSFCACSRPDKDIVPKIYIDARPAPACTDDQEKDFDSLNAQATTYQENFNTLVGYMRHHRGVDATVYSLALVTNSSRADLDNNCQLFQNKYPDGVRCTSQTKKRGRVLMSAKHKSLCDQVYKDRHKENE